MHMRAFTESIGPVKHPADQDIIFAEDAAADRANTVIIAAKAEEAAFYMHNPVPTAVQGRKSKGFDQFAFV